MSDGCNSVVVRGNEEAADLVITAGFSRSQLVEAKTSDGIVEEIALRIRNEFYIPHARVEVLDENEREVLLPIARTVLAAAAPGGDDQ